MSGMAVMIVVACVVGLVLGVALIWYVAVRGDAATVQQADFDEAYDELVAKGEITDPDREAAWRDFNARQLTEERERLRWEEAADE
jgi:hypothetical protein